MKKQILTAISTHPIRAAFLLILPFLLGPATHQALAQRNTGKRIVAASTSQLPTTSSGPISMSALRIPPMPKAPQVVLYDQYNNLGTSATADETFSDVTGFDSDLADDFVVPSGQTWNVQSIDADGVYFNGPGPANSFNVFIYTDSGGLPGTQVYSTLNQTWTQVGTTFTVNLAPAAVLAPGHYWIEIQANMTDSVGGQWGWTDRTVLSNNPAAWQNPGGGFGTPCTTWGQRGSSCGIDPGVPDQVYRLNGTMGGGGTCADYSFTSGTATFVPGVDDTGNHCDDCVTPITLPFPVTLYDQMFTTANVGSNGALFFGTANATFAITCSPLGVSGTTYAMGPYWDDQVTFSTGQGIFTTTTGTAPNRVFYIEWRSAYYTTGQPLNYEIALYENGTPPFRYIYNSIPVKTSSNDSQLVVGVKKDDTTGDFTQYGCDPTGGTNPPVSSGQALTASCAGGISCTPCNTSYTTTTSTGTIVPGTVDTGNHCDDCATPINFPFPVSFYGTTYNTANVSSNGSLDLTGTQAPFTHGCQVLPSTLFSAAILPYQDDLRTDQAGTGCAGFPGGQCGVFTSVTGTAPNRQFNIEWRAVHFADTTTSVNFEVVFYESQPSFFDIFYGQTNDNGSDETSGVQASSTGPATTFSCGVATLTNGLKVRYTLPPPCAGPVPTDAVSRKVHGAAGTFDIELPRVDIHGAVGIEDRTQGTGGATCGAWNLAANYPGGTLESSAVSTNGTYAYAAGGFVNLAPSNLLYRYDPVANTWTPLANMPDTVYDGRAAYAANVNKVYVFGGYNGSAVLNTTYIYDVASNTWTAGAPMPDFRIWAEAAYYSGNGKIYVIGGLDSSFTEQSQTWEYDPVANTWNTSRTAAPVGEGSSNTAVSGQFIYLMGGYGGSVGSTNHYRYDILGDTWTAMAPLPVPNRMAGSGNIGGQNYLFGGGTPSLGAAGVKNLKVANLKVANLKVANPKVANPKAALHASHASPGANPKVAPYASQEAPDAYTSTYIYDIASNTWSTGPNMNAPHSWTNGAAIGNTLVVVAGFNGTTGDTNTVETTACVTGGAFNHQMVVTFANPVTVQSASVTTGTGSVASFTVVTNVVTVNLTGVTNAQRLGVTLHNVCDGTNQGDVLIPMGVLSGDVNGNGTVSAADVALTKAQVGHAVGGSNFREDVNANGVLNAIDVAIVKSKTGTALPP